MGALLSHGENQKPFFYVEQASILTRNRKKPLRSVLGTDPARSSFLATPQHIDKSGGEASRARLLFRIAAALVTARCSANSSPVRQRVSALRKGQQKGSPARQPSKTPSPRVERPVGRRAWTGRDREAALKK